jgi:hypothetical protein
MKALALLTVALFVYSCGEDPPTCDDLSGCVYADEAIEECWQLEGYVHERCPECLGMFQTWLECIVDNDCQGRDCDPALDHAVSCCD